MRSEDYNDTVEVVFNACPCGNETPKRYTRIVVDRVLCPITLLVQCHDCGRKLPAHDEPIKKVAA